MKTKGNVLLAAFIAMTSAAAAQQVTTRQQATIQTSADVRAGKKGVNAGTAARVEHSGEASAAKQQDTKASAKSDTRAGQSTEVELKRELDAVNDGVEAVGDEVGAAKKEGLEVAQQVAGSAAASVNATAAAAAEGSAKVQQAAAVAASSVGGAVQSATKANAALEGTVKGALAVPQAGEALQGAGELPVKPAMNANTLVNGSLKGAAPMKLQAAGAVNNAMKINVTPLKAQVRNVAAGRISIL
ncbi:hypothetical protein ACQKLP_19930 [Chitinophaga sp. NPDC101104]|uniref:hypothetical protein n=1 Tax=Chitinophaga sp. NPDC101104 TaxID=3390561 RepID=UPI003D07A356